MQFPKVRHCLVCENVRPEAGGLSTIVGFYGVAPDVRIKLPSIENPVPYLAFLLIGGEVEGDFEMKIRISDDADSVIFEAPSSKFVAPDKRGELRVGVNITGLKFPRAGLYKIILFVNGKLNFDEIFEVVVRPPTASADGSRLSKF